MPFTPLQILWLNLLTDTVPALALAAEPPDPLVMRRPPRPPRRPLLTPSLLGSAVTHAVFLTAATIGAFALALGRDATTAGTVAFLTLAAAQVLHLVNARSPRPVLTPARLLANRYALGAVAVCAAMLLATVHVPVLSRVLRLYAIDGATWLLVLAFATLPALAGQLWRALPRRRT
jgi:Ca2+-transporting ATPase